MPATGGALPKVGSRATHQRKLLARSDSLLPKAEFLHYESVAHGPMVTHVEQLATDIADRAMGAS